MDDDLKEARRFRLEFGLRSDLAYISAVASDPSASVEYGIPLRSSEVQLLESRDASQARLWNLFEALESMGDQYGGHYIDAKTGELHVVLVDSGAVSEEILFLVPSGVTPLFHAGQFSLAHLRATQEAVGNASRETRRAGIELVSIKVDVKSNRVELGVVSPSAQDSAILRDQFGDAVIVVPGEYAETAACVDRTNCGPPGDPLRGGLHTVGGGMGCTSGYVGKAVMGPTMYLVTAGHCLDFAGGSGVQWSHKGVSFGTAESDGYYWGTSSDWGAIKLFTNPASDNLVYASSSADQRNMTAKYTDAQMPVGKLICRSGMVSGYTCGQVTATNTWLIYAQGPTLVTHLWQTSFDSAEGNSGATMMSNSTIGGILSGHGGGHSYYSTVQRTEINSGVRPCLASTC